MVKYAHIEVIIKIRNQPTRAQFIMMSERDTPFAKIFNVRAEDYDSAPIDDLKLRGRPLSLMRQLGITTIGDLLRKSEDDLDRKLGYGVVTIGQTRNALAKYFELSDRVVFPDLDVNSDNRRVLQRMIEGNKLFVSHNRALCDVSLDKRQHTSVNGQHPYAIVITCSDSRVIPDAIFSASIGELFVIRVAGNVLDNHQLGSIEYAFSHLDANLIIMLGHTKCGAIAAAQHPHGDDIYIKYIVDDIREAIGDECDDYKATILNVKHGVKIIEDSFHDHPDIEQGKLDVVGAVYDIETGIVEWL